MEKAALYLRLSEEDRIKEGGVSQSILNQRLMLLDHAKKQGWQVVAEYNDEDYSGADRSRPAFNRMLEDARAGKFTLLLCKSQSRLTRLFGEQEELLHEKFPRWGVRFVSLVDHADTDNPANKKSRQINALINEWYLEDLSENIRRTYRAKMAAGQFLGVVAPYGYEKDPADRHRLAVDPPAACVVREIFARFLSGEGTCAIARSLTKQGIPTPSRYFRQKGLPLRLPKEGKAAWSPVTVKKILQNPVYLGHMVQGRETTRSYKDKSRIKKAPGDWVVVKNTHAPLVTEADFARAAEQLAKK